MQDTDRAGALRVADKVHAAIANLTLHAYGIAAGSVTVSIGLAQAPGLHVDPDALYQAADAALYAAKSAGRNRTCCEPHDAAGSPRSPALRLVNA